MDSKSNFLLENESNVVRRWQLLKGIMEGWKEERQNREKSFLGEERTVKVRRIQTTIANTNKWLEGIDVGT